MALVELPCPGDTPPSDAELLRRFMERHDRQAAEELIRRHGQLVMDVCRRILGRSADADDAFQATFLVLLRGGLRLREPRSLSAWLYGTAWRIAVRLRTKLARQQSMEAGMEPHAVENPFEQVAARHDLEVFDAELARLPDRYRASLVLHYLEGRSQREIAQTLGASEAAVEGLLKRGRTELRARLARRGVVLTTTLAAVAVQDGLVSAADWSPLVESTIQAATVQSPQAWENASNAPRAETLFQQELKIMWLQKLSLGGAIAAGGTLAVTLLGWSLLGNSLIVGAAEGPSGVTPVSSEIVLAAAEEPAAVAVEAPAAGGGGFPGGAEGAFGGGPQNGGGVAGGGGFRPTPIVPSMGGMGSFPAGAFPGAGPTTRQLSMPLDQETLDELLERPVSLTYQQVNWGDALFTLQYSGLPIDIDLSKDLAALGVDPREKVDLNIGKVSTKSALRLLLKPHGLEAKLVDGKLKIVKAETAGMAGGRTAAQKTVVINASAPALQLAGLPPEETRIHSVLDQETEFDFVDLPLREALFLVGGYHKINILIDEISLLEAGVDSDTPVTMQLTRITLRKALDLLLSPAKLGYIVEDEVLKVRSQAMIGQSMPTQVFRSQFGSEIIESLARTAKVDAETIDTGPGDLPIVIVTGKVESIRQLERLAEQVLKAIHPNTNAPAQPGSPSTGAEKY